MMEYDFRCFPGRHTNLSETKEWEKIIRLSQDQKVFLYLGDDPQEDEILSINKEAVKK